MTEEATGENFSLQTKIEIGCRDNLCLREVKFGKNNREVQHIQRPSFDKNLGLRFDVTEKRKHFHLRKLCNEEEDKDDDEQLGGLVGALGPRSSLAPSLCNCTTELRSMGCRLEFVHSLYRMNCIFKKVVGM